MSGIPENVWKKGVRGRCTMELYEVTYSDNLQYLAVYFYRDSWLMEEL